MAFLPFLLVIFVLKLNFRNKYGKITQIFALKLENSTILQGDECQVWPLALARVSSQLESLFSSQHNAHIAQLSRKTEKV